MPARSNDFQRMIFAIQSHLSDRGSVAESKFLIDKDTQNPVEIDVVVEDVVGGFPIVIGIECVDRKRPATIEWLREMITKHEGLPISKTVLVSKSGFTKEAALKAKKNNIQLLTPKQAEQFSWSSLFKKFEKSNIVGFEFYPVKVSIKFHDSIANKKIEINANSIVFLDSNSTPLLQLVMQAAKDSGLTRKIMEEFHQISKFTDHFDFSFIIHDDAHFLASDGAKMKIKEISASVGFRHNSQALKFSATQVNDQIFATSKLDGSLLGMGLKGNAIATVSTGDEGALKITIIDSENKKIPMDVLSKNLKDE